MEAIRRFTADEVNELFRLQILRANERLELIDGRLYEIPPNETQSGKVRALPARLVETYGDRCQILAQRRFKASTHDLTEPDFAVMRGADPMLLVEVSQHTQVWDRQKADIYGRAGVPVYWMLDLQARRLTVYERPMADGTYTIINVHDETAEVDLPEAPGVRWRVADLLPAPR